ncbi:MAG: AEC family transporter [Clostridia bacterium]|nr:AEC family transporter [Clostridia bacterium]
MQTMLTAFTTMLMMLLYALPGFLFIKTGILKADAITPFSKLLMYVCQPLLIVYTMTRVTYSPPLFAEMGIIFLLMLVLQFGMIALFAFLFRKRMQDARFRIYTVATCLGNYAFMGIPILEAILPGFPNVLACSAMCALSINIVSWTAGCAVISQDRRYISLKKILLNPATIGLAVALPFFFLNTTPGEAIHPMMDEMVMILARMSTPLCMIIMGMRLALMPWRAVFGRPALYAVIVIKQLLLPLATFGILLILPLSTELARALLIMVACPVAAIVQNFAELLGAGQDTGAGIVLLGTTLSALTIPLIVLLLPLL